jgi:hypothetical protein
MVKMGSAVGFTGRLSPVNGDFETRSLEAQSELGDRPLASSVLPTAFRPSFYHPGGESKDQPKKLDVAGGIG